MGYGCYGLWLLWGKVLVAVLYLQKKKTKKDLSGKKSKSGATPHAPPLTRIPLPKL